MKPFGDKDLIAYHLHELPRRRARALVRALETDPSLAAESDAYAATLRAFKPGATLSVDQEVLARNWKALRPALERHHVRRRLQFNWPVPVFIGAGLAFAAAAASFVLTTHHHKTTSLPYMSSLHQAGDTPAVRPLSTGPLATEGQSSTEEQGHPVTRFAPPRITDLQDRPPQLARSQSLTPERAPVLEFIPLAGVSLPAFSATPPVPLEPASPTQRIVPATASRSRHARVPVFHEHITDLTLSMGGTLISTHHVKDSEATHSQGATHAVSAIAAFHQQLRPAVGYRIALSYTRPDFQYDYTTPNISGLETYINGQIYELAGTYVVQGPHRGILSTSAEAGGGLMAFLPSGKSPETGSNVRGTAILGVAADFALTERLELHAAYRAQVFQGPDFKYSGSFPISTTTLLSSEPTLGITYRFSRK